MLNGFFFGIIVNLIIQKWKSKHLVCHSFSGERLNLRGLRGFILQKVRALVILEIPAERLNDKLIHCIDMVDWLIFVIIYNLQTSV